jgi:hypothetical protein
VPEVPNDEGFPGLYCLLLLLFPVRLSSFHRDEIQSSSVSVQSAWLPEWTDRRSRWNVGSPFIELERAIGFFGAVS